ncbi:hypothetical protein Gpo141_00011646 [Globisporangium polare]
MTSIYPAQPQRELYREQVQQPQAPPVYQIVVSEQLPCFDPSIAIKHLFMSHERALRFARFGFIHRPKLVLVYLVGLVVRIVVVFLPRSMGEILAVISAILQVPAIFFVIMAFRWEYVKALAHTFEFCFLTSTTTLWIACCIAYIPDLRAILLPIVWVDFIDLVLIETYFGDSKTIMLIAIASGLYLMLLTGMVSFSESPSDHGVTSSFQSDEVDALTVKDALVNAMGTMMTLVVRLAYRKYSIMKSEQHGATWTQSISYRCRIALTSVAQGDPASSRRAVVKRLATTGRRKPMRFIKISELFHADNTVFPRIGSHSDLKRWQIVAIYGCGGVGYVISTSVIVAFRSGEESLAAAIALSVAAVAGLSFTLLFWLYFLSCCQRQLLARLFRSFDFLFVLVQLVASDVTSCDLLRWKWTACCAIFAELLWMTWVLLLDALTPAMKARLRIEAGHVVLVLVLLHLVKQVLFLGDILIWKSWSIHNRVLFHSNIGGYEVQFRAFPFVFGRQVTTLIWCLRILHRILTRHSVNDLVLLLGNVEYECEPITTESIVSAIATLQ